MAMLCNFWILLLTRRVFLSVKAYSEYRYDSVATTPGSAKGGEYSFLGAPPPPPAGGNLGVPGAGGMPNYKSNMSETDSRVFGSTYSGVSYTSSFDPDNVTLSRQPVYSGSVSHLCCCLHL